MTDVALWHVDVDINFVTIVEAVIAHMVLVNIKAKIHLESNVIGEEEDDFINIIFKYFYWLLI